MGCLRCYGVHAQKCLVLFGVVRYCRQFRLEAIRERSPDHVLERLCAFGARRVLHYHRAERLLRRHSGGVAILLRRQQRLDHH